MNSTAQNETHGQTWTDCPHCHTKGSVAPAFATPGIHWAGETSPAVAADWRSECVDCDSIVILEAPAPPRPRGLYDLPIFGWAWNGDARDTER